MVTVTTSGGLNLNTTVPVEVTRPPAFLVVAKTPASGTVSSSQVLALFTEPDTTDGTVEFNASIDWGDGTNDTVGVTELGGGLFEVLAPNAGHTYAKTASSPISVTITQGWGKQENLETADSEYFLPQVTPFTPYAEYGRLYNKAKAEWRSAQMEDLNSIGANHYPLPFPDRKLTEEQYGPYAAKGIRPEATDRRIAYEKALRDEEQKPSNEDMEIYLNFHDPYWGYDFDGINKNAKLAAAETIKRKSAFRETFEAQSIKRVNRVEKYYKSLHKEAKAHFAKNQPLHAGSYESFYGADSNLSRLSSWLDYVPVLGSLNDLIYNLENETYGAAIFAAVNLGSDVLLVKGIVGKGFQFIRVTVAERAIPSGAGQFVIERRAAQAALDGGARIQLRMIYQNSCFVTGTPLLTPTGEKPIEQFKIGDLILSRSEHDPEGPVESRVVEEVFVRTAPIMEIKVNGRVIKTTAEHPFWVRGKGWICSKDLKFGDELNSHDGKWHAVESVTNLNEVAIVYNLRVSEYHTYFVGARDWGFSVWAHNTCYEIRSIGNGRFGLFNRTTNRPVNFPGTQNAITSNSVDGIQQFAREAAREASQTPWTIVRQYRGGRHGLTSGPTGDGLASHHMPANSINGLPLDRGPAIQMEVADHVRTASHGHQGASGAVYRARQQQLIQQGRFGEAIQMDIDNIRQLFGNKYDDAIREMLNSLDAAMRVGLRNPPL